MSQLKLTYQATDGAIFDAEDELEEAVGYQRELNAEANLQDVLKRAGVRFAFCRRAIINVILANEVEILEALEDASEAMMLPHDFDEDELEEDELGAGGPPLSHLDTAE